MIILQYNIAASCHNFTQFHLQSRWWGDSTLGDCFQLHNTEVDDLYKAMDWLLERQNVIEGKLVRRYLKPGALVLFDMSSTYMEGSNCPLAEFGYDRDGKKGKHQVNFALLCDFQGRPLSVRVCKGSLRDSRTLIPEVRRLRKRFGIERYCSVTCLMSNSGVSMQCMHFARQAVIPLRTLHVVCCRLPRHIGSV